MGVLSGFVIRPRPFALSARRQPARLAPTMSKDCLILHVDDNVAMALRNLQRGDRPAAQAGHRAFDVTLGEPVAFGHKFALQPIARGAAVVRYGAAIGSATRDIEAGEHVHVHNIESRRGRGGGNPA
jgi:altronate dehydratase small subunit